LVDVDIQVVGADPQDLYAYSPLRFTSIDTESAGGTSEEVSCRGEDSRDCQLDRESRFQGQLSEPFSAIRIEITHPDAGMLVPTKQMLSSAVNGAVMRTYEPMLNAHGLSNDTGEILYNALEQHAVAISGDLSSILASAVTRSNYIEVPVSARVDLARYSLQVNANLNSQSSFDLMRQFANASTASVVSFEEMATGHTSTHDFPLRVERVMNAVVAGDFCSVVAGEIVARDAVATMANNYDEGSVRNIKLPQWGDKFANGKDAVYNIFMGVSENTGPQAQLQRDFPWHAVEDAIERGVLELNNDVRM